MLYVAILMSPCMVMEGLPLVVENASCEVYVCIKDFFRALE